MVWFLVAQGQGRLPVVSDADETEHGIMHRMDDEQMADIQRDVEDIDVCMSCTLLFVLIAVKYFSICKFVCFMLA